LFGVLEIIMMDLVEKHLVSVGLVGKLPRDFSDTDLGLIVEIHHASQGGRI
jgi:hypothetical protein